MNLWKGYGDKAWSYHTILRVEEAILPHGMITALCRGAPVWQERATEFVTCSLRGLRFIAVE